MLPIPRVLASFMFFVFLVWLAACSNNSPAQPRVATSAVATPDPLLATPPVVPAEELAMRLTSTSAAALNVTPHLMVSAVATTLPAQPPHTPDLDATATKQVQQVASAVAATLQPLTTPIPTAIQTPQAQQMTTAVAATLTALAMPTDISERTATINTTTLNLRTGPGTVYSVIKSYRQGTVVSIIGKESSRQWLKVKTPDGEMGWMAINYLLLSTDLSNVPTVETPPTPTPSN